MNSRYLKTEIGLGRCLQPHRGRGTEVAHSLEILRLTMRDAVAFAVE